MSTGSELIPSAQVFLGTRRQRRRRANGLAISFFACAVLTSLLLAYFQGPLVHWFIVPVFLCGVVIGRDAVDWVRGRMDVFDPAGIVGLFGVHFFFLAPLLHVILDYWMSYVTPLENWRDWLGGMAVLNLLGLVVYRMVLARRGGRVQPTTGDVWVLRGTRYRLILTAALLVTAGLQVWVYAWFGGILPYIESYTARDKVFEGMGLLFTVSESFPIIAMIGYSTAARTRPTLKTWPMLLLVLVLFFVAQMLFGGLRGSRSNTIWALVWATGIVHLTLRPLPKKLIYIGLALLLLFMYLYAFYKGAGLDALRILQGSEARAELEQRTGRTLEGTLLGDLGRADVQAYILARLWPVREDYNYALGRTYLGAITLLIPRAIWPERPPTKVKEGTEIQYGTGSHVPGIFQSTRVYGLAGEAMLNFSPFVVPFTFIPLGLLVRRLRQWRARLNSNDSRLLAYPFLVTLSLVILTSDSDNILVFLVKNGSVPFLILWWGSRTTGGDNAGPSRRRAS